MTVEPENMPIEGGLRLRVSTDGTPAQVSVSVGGTDATEPVFADGWVYATAPALSEGSYDIELTSDGVTTAAGSIGFVADLVTAVNGAVAAYVVALHEVASQAAGAADDQAREQVIAGWDMRANAVDTVIHARADAAGEDLENPAIADIWSGATNDIDALQAQITSSSIA